MKYATKERFKGLRLKYALTQQASATLLNCNPRTVRRYESGERKVPELVLNELERLAKLAPKP